MYSQVSSPADDKTSEKLVTFLVNYYSDQLITIINSPDSRLHYPIFVDFAELINDYPSVSMLIFTKPGFYLPKFDYAAISAQKSILKDSEGGSAFTVKDNVHVRINILGSPLESPDGNGRMTAGSCPNRAESPSMDTTSTSLVLVNYFPTVPNIAFACEHNSAPLVNMLDTCYNAAGKKWANFVAIDFYKKSDWGGAPAAVDKMNGQLICGCTSIAECRANMTYGSCNIPGAETLSPLSPMAELATGYANSTFFCVTFLMAF